MEVGPQSPPEFGAIHREGRAALAYDVVDRNVSPAGPKPAQQRVYVSVAFGGLNGAEQGVLKYVIKQLWWRLVEEIRQGEVYWQCPIPGVCRCASNCTGRDIEAAGLKPSGSPGADVMPESASRNRHRAAGQFGMFTQEFHQAGGRFALVPMRIARLIADFPDVRRRLDGVVIQAERGYEQGPGQKRLSA